MNWQHLFGLKKFDKESLVSKHCFRLLEGKERMQQVLPPDIVLEILIRTDIEILPRLRWVCKEWRRLFSDPHFINQHHQRSKNVCGFILDCTFEYPLGACQHREIYFFPLPSTSPLSEPLPSLTFMLEPVRIKAATPHGLLLCFGLVHEGYYVCKPTTQEWATIPTPDSRTYTLRVVLSVASNSPLRFRIMRVSQRRLRYKCEVFDSDSCGVWKTIKSVGPLFDDTLLTSTVRDGVVVDGSFFWFERKGRYEATKIICFNMTEEVTTLKLPEDIVTDKDSIGSWLLNLNGRLGLVSRSRHFVIFEYWAITNMVEGIWEKLQVLDESSQNLQVVDVSSIDDSLPHSKYRGTRKGFTGDNIVLTNPDKSRNDIYWRNFKEIMHFDADLCLERIIDNLYFFKSDYFPCNIDGCPFNNWCRSCSGDVIV